MENTVVLDECVVTLIIRTDARQPGPGKWDFNALLDMDTAIGEQAWVENVVIRETGTEMQLDVVKE